MSAPMSWTPDMFETLMRIQRELPPSASTGFLPILLDLAIFTTDDPSGRVSDDEREKGQMGLLGFLHALGAWNANWLALNPRIPKLYDASVSYHHDHGIEWWADACRAFQRKKADCKVLAAWRCADLNRQIEQYEREHNVSLRSSKPHISWRLVGPNDPGGFREGDWVYHVVIIRPADSIFIDPPPFVFSPAGPTLYPAKIQRDAHTIVDMPGWLIEDPSRVLGMGWENEYAGSNHRPASPEFEAWFRDRFPDTPWQQAVVQPVLPQGVSSLELMMAAGAPPVHGMGAAPVVWPRLPQTMGVVPVNFGPQLVPSHGLHGIGAARNQRGLPRTVAGGGWR